MVEGVERLETEFQRACFRESSDLVQSHVIIVDPGTVEETPGGSSKSTQHVRAEDFGVKGQRVVARIVVDIQRTQTWIVIRQIDADAVHTIVFHLDEGVAAEALASADVAAGGA